MTDQNVCEHGDHPAPDGKRFCGTACQRCEIESTNEETGCDNICGLATDIDPDCVLTFEIVKERLEGIEHQLALRLGISDLSPEAIREVIVAQLKQDLLVEDELVADWHEWYAWFIHWND